jgi:hypothetical protein
LAAGLGLQQAPYAVAQLRCLDMVFIALAVPTQKPEPLREMSIRPNRQTVLSV